MNDRVNVRDSPMMRSVREQRKSTMSKSDAAVQAVAEYLAERDGCPCFKGVRYAGAHNQRVEYSHLAAALLAGEVWAFLKVRGDGIVDLGAELEGMYQRTMAAQ